MPLEHIGRYKIEAELGRGAMGVVYRATDPNIGRTVALKTLRVDVHGMESEEMLKRFQAEARNAGVLNHANIVTIYDAQEIEGLFYIAMEFIQGQTLQELHKQGGVPVERIIDITKQVCAGLDYAHARGIVHRDVKPANIMIEPDGTVKIMDFGIAKHAGTGMTSTGQVLGTPNYMSPEQVKGKTLDGRSDLFSLGVVLYEMLTGERPFTGENVTTIIYKIVNENPPSPRDLDITVHPGLSAVVMKSLAKNRDERYQKCADLARELENYKNFGNDTGQTTKIFTDSQAVAAVHAVAQPPVVVTATTGTGAAVKRAPKLESTVNVAKPVAKPSRPVPVASKKIPVPFVAGAVAVVIAIVGLVGYKLKHPDQPTSSAGEQVAQPAAATGETASAPIKTPSAPSRTERSGSVGKSAAKSSSTPKSEAVVPTGDLHITTTPPGATVNVDGKDQPQITPGTFKLTSGQHTVVVSLDGYRPEVRHPEINVGERTNMTAMLTATAGFMMVNSIPSGADILVDGKPTGSVTPARIKVSQGQHTFTVHKQGAKDQSSSLFVLAGQTLPLEFTLPGATAGQPAKKSPDSVNVPPSNASAASKTATPDQKGDNEADSSPFKKLRRIFGGKEEGSVILRTTPMGADVWVDGKVTSYKTPIKFPASPGKYKVSLRLPGYKPLTRQVQIEKGKTTTIEETLEKQ